MSELKQKLNDDLKLALRSGDKMKLGTLRLLLSAVKYTEIAKQAELTDADIYGVIAKEIKQRHESIEAYEKGKRPDLVAQEQGELNILQSYLPRQVSREEIVATAQRIISETGAKGPGDKGKVMPKMMAELKGKADGRVINEVVTELLTK